MSTGKKQTDQFEGSEQQLAKRLSNHLQTGEAFMPVDDLLKQIPLQYVGKNLEDIPYTIYELVYHMRLAQLDTLLRQILLLIEHNAYHIGQLYVMNRLLP